jgi:protein gp37
MAKMNKQGPGKIDWTDYTWNPISGCYHGCPYCYVAAMARRFKTSQMEPRFHVGRLSEPFKLKYTSKVFAGSSGDMWGVWVPDEQILSVMACVESNPQHTFQFLTKNPDRFAQFRLPKNGWYGTTVDGTHRTGLNLASLLAAVRDRVRFVSFEPLLHRVDIPLRMIAEIDWMIIGANSQRGAVKPPDIWADHLIEQARAAGAAVWVKDNYQYPYVIKEFPDGCENGAR